MTTPEFPEAKWRKSSYSGTQNECVEVAVQSDAVGIRDSRSRDAGMLTASRSAWCVFVADIVSSVWTTRSTLAVKVGTCCASPALPVQ